MEIVYFTLAAICLYVLSDRILNQIETMLGKRLPQRPGSRHVFPDPENGRLTALTKVKVAGGPRS